MDNDGLLDIYLANYGGDVGNQLFKNTMSNTNNWLKIKVIGVESNRSGIGARAVLKIGSRSLMDEVNGGNSWASQSSLVLHFGLGTASTVDLLTVRWPSGIIDSFENVAANQLLEITEGESKVSDTDPTQGPQIDSLPEQFVEGPFGYGLSGASNANLLDEAISIMPNPFNEELAVVFNQMVLNANVLEIRLLDGAGRELVQQEIKRKPTVLSINTQNVPAGLYYLQIITEWGAFTLKAMKL
jgi:hypothetical protein